MDTTQLMFRYTFIQQLLIAIVTDQRYPRSRSFFKVCVKTRWQIPIFTDNSKHFYFQVCSL